MPQALGSRAASEPHCLGQLPMELVNVQTALMTSDPETPALVYDEHRKRLVQQALDDGTKDAMGTDAKAFFEAEYQPAVGRWKIGKRVNDQAW